MKYKGKKLEGRNSDIIVFKRGGDRVVFKAEAVQDYEEFDKLVQEPIPPTLMRPGGRKTLNLEAPEYKEALIDFASKKTDWLILKSLSVTEDLEWETIDFTKPDTWKNWRTELQEAGFTEIECIRILNLCTSVNSLNDDMLEAAKEDFLHEVSLASK